MSDKEQYKQSALVPTVFVVFGVTGDLAKRKLFPALYHLYTKGHLPTKFRIIGFAHSEYTEVSLRAYVRELLFVDDVVQCDAFLEHISYVRGGFGTVEGFETLVTKLRDIDDEIGQCTNKLFHLAVPPSFYEPLLRNLAAAKLTAPCDDANGWTRVLIEKPFGRDAKTARALDELLGDLFEEKQIYRIDHYLAKETVQNILMFRFANAIFTPSWNDQYIERVEITMSEDIDVSTRGAFYDDIGALRDVGQNHLLQLLAAVTMEQPKKFDAQYVREERAKVISHLCFATDHRLVRGQYAGFLGTKGVAENSQTETFFKVEGFIDTDRWRKTRFIMAAGKALDQKKVFVRMVFREPSPCFCPGEEHTQNNEIIFSIQPEGRISVRFFAKEHGLGTTVTEKLLDFSYDTGDTGIEEIDAYVRVIYDAVIGDQVLFASTDEVEASWRAMMPILEAWGNHDLVLYEKGASPWDIK